MSTTFDTLTAARDLEAAGTEPRLIRAATAAFLFVIGLRVFGLI